MFLAYIDPGSGFTILSVGGWLIAFLLGFIGAFSVFFKKIFKFFKRWKKIIILTVLIVIVLTLTITGVVMSKRGSKFNKKIVILGFDGLSPKIVEQLMEDGKLPNFSLLKSQGSYARLSTTNPSQSPVAWAGFATGQNPGKNGVFDFIIRDPKTYGLKLSLSNIEKGKPKRVIKSKCFWQYTSQKKIPTTLIGCPLTFPPDKIYGRMLSGMGVPDILGTEGTFSFYTTESIKKDKEIGGKVFEIKKSPVMLMTLTGPRKAILGGKPENLKVPFKVILQESKESAIIELQNQKFEIKKGQWSDWKKVAFKLGLFQKIRGILKFYLVETEPEFKLYVSPINFDPTAPFFQISSPKGYSKELAENLGFYHTQGMPMDTWAVNEGRLSEEAFLELVHEVSREKTQMLNFELKRFNRGILFCYFEDPDIIQHMFWRYIDPQHPLYEKEPSQEYKDVIQYWYRKMDEITGNVMKELDKEDILIVLSDHGFDTFREAIHVNSWLKKNGYLELKDSRAKEGEELLEDVDWTRTKAYSIGFGAIYINQEGRERDGIVKPGREIELLKDEIARKLKGWVSSNHDKPIIANVYSKGEIFWGEYADQTPDLYIGFAPGYRASWQTALGAVPEPLTETNLKKWSGDHLFDPPSIPGILFSNKKIIKANSSLYDIAPTILKLCGFDKASLDELNLDGRPLF